MLSLREIALFIIDNNKLPNECQILHDMYDTKDKSTYDILYTLMNSHHVDMSDFDTMHRIVKSKCGNEEHSVMKLYFDCYSFYWSLEFSPFNVACKSYYYEYICLFFKHFVYSNVTNQLPFKMFLEENLNNMILDNKTEILLFLIKIPSLQNVFKSVLLNPLKYLKSNIIETLLKYKYCTYNSIEKQININIPRSNICYNKNIMHIINTYPSRMISIDADDYILDNYNERKDLLDFLIINYTYNFPERLQYITLYLSDNNYQLTNRIINIFSNCKNYPINYMVLRLDKSNFTNTIKILMNKHWYYHKNILSSIISVIKHNNLEVLKLLLSYPLKNISLYRCLINEQLSNSDNLQMYKFLLYYPGLESYNSISVLSSIIKKFPLYYVNSGINNIIPKALFIFLKSKYQFEKIDLIKYLYLTKSIHLTHIQMQKLFDHLCIKNIFFKASCPTNLTIYEYTLWLSDTEIYLQYEPDVPNKIHEQIILKLISSHHVNPHIHNNISIINSINNNFHELAISLINRDDTHLIDNASDIYIACINNNNLHLIETMNKHFSCTRSSITQKSLLLTISKKNSTELSRIFIKNYNEHIYDAQIFITESVKHDNIILFKYMLNSYHSQDITNLKKILYLCFEHNSSKILIYILNSFYINLDSYKYVEHADKYDRFDMIKLLFYNKYILFELNKTICNTMNIEGNISTAKYFLKYLDRSLCFSMKKYTEDVLRRPFNFINIFSDKSHTQYIRTFNDKCILFYDDMENIVNFTNTYDSYLNSDIDYYIECSIKHNKESIMRYLLRMIKINNLICYKDRITTVFDKYEANSKYINFSCLPNMMANIIHYNNIFALKTFYNNISHNEYFLKAVQKNRIDIVQYISVSNKIKMLGLFLAIKLRRHKIIEYLLSDKDMKITPRIIMSLSSNGHTLILKRILKQENIVNKLSETNIIKLIKQNDSWATRLFESKRVLNPRIIQQFLLSASKYNHVNKMNYYIKFVDPPYECISNATKEGHIDIIKILIKHYENKNENIRLLFSDCISLASQYEHDNLVKFLIISNVSDPNYNDNSAIKMAIKKDNIKLVNILLSHNKVRVEDLKLNICMIQRLSQTNDENILSVFYSKNINRNQRLFLLSRTLGESKTDTVEKMLRYYDNDPKFNPAVYLHKTIDACCIKETRLLLTHPMFNILNCKKHMNNFSHKIDWLYDLVYSYCDIEYLGLFYSTENSVNENDSYFVTKLIFKANHLFNTKISNEKVHLRNIIAALDIPHFKLFISKVTLDADCIVQIIKLILTVGVQRLLDIFIDYFNINLLHYPYLVVKILQKFACIQYTMLNSGLSDISMNSSLILYNKYFFNNKVDEWFV